MTQYYIGTDLKFLVNIQCEGFNMDTDGYEIILVSNARRMVVAPSQIAVDGNDHYLCIDSSKMGVGPLKMIVKAHVPDNDFSDGYRTEVAVLDLCQIIPTR